MTADPTKARVMGNWILCRGMTPKTMTKSGLHMPKDFDRDVVTEGVAEVIGVGPGEFNKKTGIYTDHGIEVGERVVYRGFLRYAEQVGDLFGGERASEYFFINAKDLLCTVSGTDGTVGFYDEYEM